MQPSMSHNMFVHESRAKRCRIDDPLYGLGPTLEVAVRKVDHHQASFWLTMRYHRRLREHHKGVESQRLGWQSHASQPDR